MSRFFLLAFIVPVLSCCSSAGTDNGGSLETIYVKMDGAVRLVAYNVGTFNKVLSDSSPTVAAMMQEIYADAIVMNELDMNNDRHNYDQLGRFAGYMGWNYFFGKAMDYRNGEYGNGIAYSTDLEVADEFVISLPKDTGSEDRSCVVVEFSSFVFAGTHLEVNSVDDRISGVNKITSELKERYAGGDKPVFLGGDMNSFPGSEVITEILKDWVMITPTQATYPADDPVNCADYIFALKSTGSYSVSASGVLTKFYAGNVSDTSDHLPVYADIILD